MLSQRQNKKTPKNNSNSSNSLEERNLVSEELLSEHQSTTSTTTTTNTIYRRRVLQKLKILNRKVQSHRASPLSSNRESSTQHNGQITPEPSIDYPKNDNNFQRKNNNKKQKFNCLLNTGLHSMGQILNKSPGQTSPTATNHSKSISSMETDQEQKQPNNIGSSLNHKQDSVQTQQMNNNNHNKKKKKTGKWYQSIEKEALQQSLLSQEDKTDQVTRKREAYDLLGQLISDKKLSDLHTHLTGMGSWHFWINTIMDKYLPSIYHYKCELYPNILVPAIDIDMKSSTRNAKIQRLHFIDRVMSGRGAPLAQIQKRSVLFTDSYQSAMDKCLTPSQFELLVSIIRTDFQVPGAPVTKELKRAFEELGPFELEFTVQVVYSRASLLKSGFDLEYPPLKQRIKDYWVFNANEQFFDYKRGITNESLLELAYKDDKIMNQLKNCFTVIGSCEDKWASTGDLELGEHDCSLLHRDAGEATKNQVHTNHNNHIHHQHKLKFSPNFYPQHFSLKEEMYSQYLIVNDKLLNHVCQRYARNGVSYVEFSITCRHLLFKPWFARHLLHPELTDEPLEKMTEEETTVEAQPKQQQPQSQQQPHRQQQHQPSPQPSQDLQEEEDEEEDNSSRNYSHRHPLGSVRNPLHGVQFNYLAAINRMEARLPIPNEKGQVVWKHAKDPVEASHILSSNDSIIDIAFYDTFLYHDFVEDLQRMESLFRDSDILHERIVGLDFMGDELGFPYCPFWLDEFLEFAQRRMRYGNGTGTFGLRAHTGEISDHYFEFDEGTKSFIPKKYEGYEKHRLIVSGWIKRFLKKIQSLEEPIPAYRFGHGVSIMADQSAIDLAQMGALLPIEVNLSSNCHLLDYNFDTHPVFNLKRKQKDETMKKPQLLYCTDNDGVFQIRCSCEDQNHHSVAAELCRAIQLGLIDKKALKTMVNDCNYHRFASMDIKKLLLNPQSNSNS